MPGPTRQDLLREAWRRGRLRYKLRVHQPPLYDFISTWRPDEARKVVKAARRLGKSFVLCLFATEFAIQHRGSQIRFAAPTEKALRKIIRPNMRVILGDCPDDLRPKWNTQDSCFTFPNGSEWHLAGTDKDNAEKLRGTGTDLAIVDEAGFHDDLSYVVDDILTPQLLDNGGRLVMISTPARTPGHAFTSRFCPEAEADGSLFVRTIRDNTHLSPEMIERYVKALGGWTSTATRRELLCEDVVDEDVAVIPEFTPAEKTCVVDHPRPSHFEPFEVMDPGFSPSQTAVLFGYYDFLAAKWVIEDELTLQRMRTDQLAEGIRAKEKELWPDKYDRTDLERKIVVPHRWSDIEPILLNDLACLHKLAFAPTSKDNLDAMVNKARIWVRSDRVRIHPRCKSLIAQLKSAVWNKPRTEFEMSTAFGHYDAVAAFVYGVRNVPESRNPYPAIPVGVASPTHWIPGEMFQPTGNAAVVGEMFKIGGRKKP